MQGATPREPRLRMGHLLLWIAGCAVGFAERRSIANIDLPTGRDRVLMIGSSVVWAVALGTVLTGCVLMAYRRWQGDRSCPSLAGHWLLLRILAIDVTSTASGYFRIPFSLTSAIVLMIDLAFLRGLYRRLPRHWVAVFLVDGLAAAIRMIDFLAFPFSLTGIGGIGLGSSLVMALTILWAIGRDRRSGAPADGLHRLGVGTALALDASSVLFYLAMLFW